MHFGILLFRGYCDSALPLPAKG